MKDYISKLDFDRFGFKIAKVDNFTEKPIALIEKFKNEGVNLVISRVQSCDIKLLNELEEIGFRIKDTQATYKYSLDENSPIYFSNPNNLLIRNFKDEDLIEILDITEEAFYGYGHYFADIKLDSSKCMEVYKDWIKRSCLETEVADKVFVAEKDNHILGYLTFKVYVRESLRYAVGGIGAVSKKYRNLGVFPFIAVNALKWGLEEKQSWQEHNVISSNYAVNRAFSKIGFRIVDSMITLHYWID